MFASPVSAFWWNVDGIVLTILQDSFIEKISNWKVLYLASCVLLFSHNPPPSPSPCPSATLPCSSISIPSSYICYLCYSIGFCLMIVNALEITLLAKSEFESKFKFEFKSKSKSLRKTRISVRCIHGLLSNLEFISFSYKWKYEGQPSSQSIWVIIIRTQLYAGQIKLIRG